MILFSIIFVCKFPFKLYWCSGNSNNWSLNCKVLEWLCIDDNKYEYVKGDWFHFMITSLHVNTFCITGFLHGGTTVSLVCAQPKQPVLQNFYGIFAVSLTNLVQYCCSISICKLQCIILFKKIFSYISLYQTFVQIFLPYIYDAENYFIWSIWYIWSIPIKYINSDGFIIITEVEGSRYGSYSVSVYDVICFIFPAPSTPIIDPSFLAIHIMWLCLVWFISWYWF